MMKRTLRKVNYYLRFYFFKTYGYFYPTLWVLLFISFIILFAHSLEVIRAKETRIKNEAHYLEFDDYSPFADTTNIVKSLDL